MLNVLVCGLFVATLMLQHQAVKNLGKFVSVAFLCSSLCGKYTDLHYTVASKFQT